MFNGDIVLCNPYDIINNFVIHFKLVYSKFSTDIFNNSDVGKNMSHIKMNYIYMHLILANTNKLRK